MGRRTRAPGDALDLPAGLVDSVVCRDNLALLTALPAACCDLIYIDPPFMTNSVRSGPSGAGFDDRWSGPTEYLDFLGPRLVELQRVLRPTGCLYVHLDHRAAHYVKVRLDEIFGADNFLNEIIWSYRTGGRSPRWFARKHDTILVYARARGRHVFNVIRDGNFRTDGLKHDECGRPYKSTRRGRLYFNAAGPALTDVWEIPFLSTVATERTGYPSQKPERLLERIIQAGSNPDALVADFFCGSGTALAVARRMGRHWLGCDVSPQAVRIAKRRLNSIDHELLPGL